MDNGGRRHTAAMGPHPGNKARNKQLHHMRRVYIVKTRKKIFITSNITNNACRVDVDERRRRCSNATMGAVQPTGRYRRFRRHVTAPNDIFGGGERGGKGWGRCRLHNLSASGGGDGDTGVVTTQRCLPVRHVITLTKSMVHI